ncbi:MAG TPA: hypothetical protein PKD80_13430 [Microthrixaceae bacterium]|nr:hypothetical protein [Microthrixaceae bacterium]
MGAPPFKQPELGDGHNERHDEQPEAVDGPARDRLDALGIGDLVEERLSVVRRLENLELGVRLQRVDHEHHGEEEQRRRDERHRDAEESARGAVPVEFGGLAHLRGQGLEGCEHDHERETGVLPHGGGGNRQQCRARLLDAEPTDVAPQPGLGLEEREEHHRCDCDRTGDRGGEDGLEDADSPQLSIGSDGEEDAEDDAQRHREDRELGGDGERSKEGRRRERVDDVRSADPLVRTADEGVAVGPVQAQIHQPVERVVRKHREHREGRRQEDRAEQKVDSAVPD